MSDSLKTIAQQLVRQAVEVSEQESKKILFDAHEQAEKIKQQAREEANSLVETALEQVERINAEGLREWHRAARILKDKLQQDLRNLIVAHVVSTPLQENLSLRLHEIVLELLRNTYHNTDGRLEIRISESVQKDVVDKLHLAVHDFLHTGVDISVDQDSFTGFYIRREQDHYRIAFTQAEFEDALMPYLSSALRQFFVPTHEE